MCLINDVNKRITWEKLFNYDFSYIFNLEDESIKKQKLPKSQEPILQIKAKKLSQ